MGRQADSRVASARAGSLRCFQFSEHSHRFRPGRGRHTGFTEIAIHWKRTRWFIEGDIKGCFDNIDWIVLLNILREKIKDDRLMKLIRHMLEAGYIEDWKYHHTWSGTPQSGVIMEAGYGRPG